MNGSDIRDVGFFALDHAARGCGLAVRAAAVFVSSGGKALGQGLGKIVKGPKGRAANPGSTWARLLSPVPCGAIGIPPGDLRRCLCVAGWFGNPDLTIQQILGYVSAPLAWLLGVPWPEAMQGGSFIGQKLILNEFVAYADFVQVKDALTPGTRGILTFALCGFANLSSIAILLGGIGGMAPTRFGLKAVLAASLSNFMSAAIAGFFLHLGG